MNGKGVSHFRTSSTSCAKKNKTSRDSVILEIDTPHLRANSEVHHTKHKGNLQLLNEYKTILNLKKKLKNNSEEASTLSRIWSVFNPKIYKSIGLVQNSIKKTKERMVSLVKSLKPLLQNIESSNISYSKIDSTTSDKHNSKSFLIKKDNIILKLREITKDDTKKPPFLSRIWALFDPQIYKSMGQAKLLMKQTKKRIVKLVKLLKPLLPIIKSDIKDSEKVVRGFALKPSEIRNSLEKCKSNVIFTRRVANEIKHSRYVKVMGTITSCSSFILSGGIGAMGFYADGLHIELPLVILTILVSFITAAKGKFAKSTELMKNFKKDYLEEAKYVGVNFEIISGIWNIILEEVEKANENERKRLEEEEKKRKEESAKQQKEIAKLNEELNKKNQQLKQLKQKKNIEREIEKKKTHLKRRLEKFRKEGNITAIHALKNGLEFHPASVLTTSKKLKAF